MKLEYKILTLNSYPKAMSLLQPLPINYQNAAIEQQTLKGIVHLATVLAESYDRFWNLKPEVNELLGFVGRTPEALIADLNSDYALANERNTKHYLMATTVNQWLADAGHALRVPIAMPEGYTNDGNAFAYTAPEPEVVIEPEVIAEPQPEPELEPEPQPEPEPQQEL